VLFVSFQRIQILNQAFLLHFLRITHSLLQSKSAISKLKSFEFHRIIQCHSRRGFISIFLYLFQVREISIGFSTRVHARYSWLKKARKFELSNTDLIEQTIPVFVYFKYVKYSHIPSIRWCYIIGVLTCMSQRYA
jgi:hypothetical protein